MVDQYLRLCSMTRNSISSHDVKMHTGEMQYLCRWCLFCEDLDSLNFILYEDLYGNTPTCPLNVQVEVQVQQLWDVLETSLDAYTTKVITCVLLYLSYAWVLTQALREWTTTATIDSRSKRRRTGSKEAVEEEWPTPSDCNVSEFLV